jgi:hypothetical protein
VNGIVNQTMALKRIDFKYIDINGKKFWYNPDPYWETVHEGRRSDTVHTWLVNDEGDAGHHAICRHRPREIRPGRS